MLVNAVFIKAPKTAKLQEAADLLRSQGFAVAQASRRSRTALVLSGEKRRAFLDDFAEARDRIWPNIQLDALCKSESERKPLRDKLNRAFVDISTKFIQAENPKQEIVKATSQNLKKVVRILTEA